MIESDLNLESTFSKESLSHLYASGYDLYRNGKYLDARDFFRFITYANPQDRRSWMGLGACYQMVKLYKQAIECYSVAAIQNPEDPYVHFHAAECYHLLGENEVSIETLDSAMTAAKSSDAPKSLIERIENLKELWLKKGDVYA